MLLEDAQMNGDDSWDKKARQNVCIADFSQEPDYENKKGTVVNFSELPVMKTLREKLPEFLEEAEHLLAEGNYYTDLKQKEVGIGFHGIRSVER